MMKNGLKQPNFAKNEKMLPKTKGCCNTKEISPKKGDKIRQI